MDKLPRWRHLGNQARHAKEKWVKTQHTIDVKMGLADHLPALAYNSLAALLQHPCNAQLANVYSKQTAACSLVMHSAKASSCARICPVLVTPASV